MNCETNAIDLKANVLIQKPHKNT